MKKVLIIAYHFPPIGGSGMQRTVKFVKYLASFGWKPVVLSVMKGKSYELIDSSFLGEVPPDIKVYRTKWFSLFGVVKVPDKKIGWLPFAVLRGLKVLRQEKIKVIYTTSPVVTVHLIGYLLKKISRLPWVADFRDPWIGNPGRINIKGVRKLVEEWLEKKVVYNADKVIANTDFLKADFEKRYDDAAKDKFVTITNGYAPEDFVGVAKNNGMSENGKFVITHTGEFYEKIRNPSVFLKAIGILLREKKLNNEDIIINFVGSGDYTKSEQYKRFIKKYCLEQIIKDIDHVHHRESIQFLYFSHILLLFNFSNGRLQIPAKTYEYIKVGKPILALTEEGALSSLLENIDSATIVDLSNVDQIKKAVYKLYSDFKGKKLKVDIDERFKNKFNRKLLTKILADVFDGVISKGGRN